MLLVSVPFNGTGFVSWKTSMLIALSAKNKIGFVNGCVEKPSKDSPDLRCWERCNDMVISWILNALVKDISDSVLYNSTAKEIWTELEQRFSQSNGAHLFQLQRDLSQITQGNFDIATYFTKVKRLCDELNAIDVLPVCTCGLYRLFSRENMIGG